MNKNTSEKENKRVYHIMLNSSIDEKLVDMMEYYGASAPAMIRMCINDFFGGKYKKETLGYFKGVTGHKEKLKKIADKEEREKITRELEVMDDFALSDWLITKGFAPADAPHPTDQDKIIQYRVNTNESGNRVYTEFHFNAKSGGFSYTSDQLTFPELVKALLEKKII